jgi:hypothetical protein
VTTRFCVTATWDDVPHLSQKQKDEMWSAYPEYERDARAKGIPMLGSGRVFPVPEAKIKVEPFRIPSYWSRIVGVDFGWDHPFAAANLAWDRDADCIYLTAGYRQREATPAIHSTAIRAWGDWIPVAWPHDGLQHDKTSGQQLQEHYRFHGLNMLAEHATHPAGGYGLEAGIIEMLERMQTDRFKVFSNINQWFDEFRLSHREDGLIVKEHDDLISATRIGIMMKRFAIYQAEDEDREREREDRSYGNRHSSTGY